MVARNLGVAVAAALCTLFTQAAVAACSLITVPTEAQLVETGDRAMASNHCIGPFLTVPSVAQRHIENFGLLADRWRSGWGFDEVCDKALPMGRAVNALELLYRGMPGPTPAASDMSGNLLHYGYNFANNIVSFIRPKCSDVNAAEYFETLAVGSIRSLTGAIWTYAPWFNNYSVVTRAGIVIHEARHKSVTHLTHRSRSGGFCTMRPITNCDLRWGDGAFTYEATWLWWFAVDGDDVTSVIRRQALTEAEWIVRNAFDERATVVPWCNC